MTLPAEAPVRRLGPADLKACLALSVDREWPAEERKWSLLLEAAEAYGVDDPGGGLAGSVVLGRYGAKLASIGMMLVASRYGRQGLGRRLMTHVLGQAGDASVFLTATTYGRPLYEKLGFRTTGRSATFVGRFRPGQTRPADLTGLTRAAREEDLATIMRVDRLAFGADREYLLRRLSGFSDRVRVLIKNGAVAGYATAWRNIDVTVIGPVVAPDAAGAQLLITSLARDAGVRVRLDLDPAGREMVGWAEARGLAVVDETAFMVHGPWPPPGDRSRLFCPLTVALG